MIDQRKPESSSQACLLKSGFIESERKFYSRYSWCLNPFPKINQVIGFLQSEIEYLEKIEEIWQINEILTNIFLLSCAISSSADDFLSGKRLDIAKVRRKIPATGSLVFVYEKSLNALQGYRQLQLESFRQWRNKWECAINSLLRQYLSGGVIDLPSYREAALELVGLLEFNFSKKLLDQSIRSPRAFRSQDLSTYDILTLSEKFCTENADKRRPILVVGLRTAGSYFAPVLHADLANRGYRDIGIMTLRPKNGASRDDREKLQKFAQRNGIVVVIDEPIYKGETLAICMKMLDEFGVSRRSVVVMFPLHFSAREWQKTNAFSALNDCRVITSNPEEYFKYEKLRDDVIEKQLEEYFFTRGWKSVSLVNDEKVQKFNAILDEKSENSFSTHLKRVYGVRLKSQSGTVETRYIIANPSSAVMKL